jgi:hypothetical protein
MVQLIKSVCLLAREQLLSYCLRQPGDQPLLYQRPKSEGEGLLIKQRTSLIDLYQHREGNITTESVRLNVLILLRAVFLTSSRSSLICFSLHPLSLNCIRDVVEPQILGQSPTRAVEFQYHLGILSRMRTALIHKIALIPTTLADIVTTFCVCYHHRDNPVVTDRSSR